MDPGLEEAARVSGARPKTVLRRITLPLLMPALAAATIYSFVSHLESFEAPLTVGLAAGIFVLSTLIYFTARYHVPGDYGLSAAYAVFFMTIMTLLSYLHTDDPQGRTLCRYPWTRISSHSLSPGMLALSGFGALCDIFSILRRSLDGGDTNGFPRALF
jgi:ABC-type Fe3+ transport system permease subunit